MWIKAMGFAALLALAAVAQGAAFGKEKRADAPAGAFIERSYIAAPREVAGFELQDARFDAANRFAGAGFRYVAEDQPDSWIDVFVYPAGDMDRATALDSGMRDFRGTLAQAAAGGAFTELVIGDDIPFALQPPAAAPDAPDAPAVAADPEADADADAGRPDIDAALLAALAEVSRDDGLKLEMTMRSTRQDRAMWSAGYLFSRSLYWIKVRASAPQEKLAKDAFHAFADRAARAVVPAIRIANVGSCADSTLVLSPDGDASAMGVALVRHAAMHEARACHRKDADIDDAALRAGAEVVEIAYEPADWKKK